MTDDIAKITYETFESHVGTTFRVGSCEEFSAEVFDDGGEPIDLELKEVEKNADEAPAETPPPDSASSHDAEQTEGGENHG